MTATSSRPRLDIAVLATLGLLAAAAPFATDMYLSAFPAMTDDLGTTASSVQLSLTAFFVGAGVGQLIFGLVSDRIGRMGPLYVGVAVFILGGIGAALAPSIAWLVFFRLVQGLGGSAGMVISRAMIADVASGRTAARALSLMMLVSGIAPVVGPVVGSLLAEPLGWRGLLWILVGLGVLTAAMVALTLRETHGREQRETIGERPPVRAVIGELRSKEYIGAVTTFSFAFAAMMAYISASPFVYQELIGLSTPMYGLAFGATAITLMAGGALSAKFVGRTGRHALIRIALAISLTAIVALTIAVLTTAPSVWWIGLIVLAVSPTALVMGNTTSLALDAVRSAKGLGSAFLGLSQFVLAGAVAPLVGIAGEETAVPMALTMLGASVIATVAFHTMLRTRSMDTLGSAGAFDHASVDDGERESVETRR